MFQSSNHGLRCFHHATVPVRQEGGDGGGGGPPLGGRQTGGAALPPGAVGGAPEAARASSWSSFGADGGLVKSIGLNMDLYKIIWLKHGYILEAEWICWN